MTETLKVRRHWSDTGRIATIRAGDLQNPHWSSESGGVNVSSPRPFIHGYIWCNQVLDGELSHSCRHGPPPHRILVCVVRKDNTAEAFLKVRGMVS